MNSFCYDPKALKKLERDAIKERRKKKEQLEGLTDDSKIESRIEETLTGMCFSGGGLRSGSFNLGLLQGLSEQDLLSRVDLLSTVSGGSYAAGYLASSVTNQGDLEAAAAKAEKEAEAARAAAELDEKAGDAVPDFGDAENNQSEAKARQVAAEAARKAADNAADPLHISTSGQLSPHVATMVRRGNYLIQDLGHFFNSQLIGIVLVGSMMVCLLITLASGTAWLFQHLSSTTMIAFFQAMGFVGDIGWALFPATIAFALWLVLWILAFFKFGVAAIGFYAQRCLLVALVLLTVGITVLMTSGDVGFWSIGQALDRQSASTNLRSLESSRQTQQKSSQLQEWIKTIVVGITSFGLLPFLRPKSLIRSGIAPHSRAEGWIFTIASGAFVVGIPLLTFGWFARENVSGYNEKRERLVRNSGYNENRHQGQEEKSISAQYDLVYQDFRNWATAWRQIQRLATTMPGGQNDPYPLADALWNTANNTDLKAISSSELSCKEFADLKSQPILLSLKIAEHEQVIDDQLWHFQRWGLLVARVAYLQAPGWIPPDRVSQLIRLKKLRRDIADAVCRKLTDTLLLDLDFYKRFGDEIYLTSLPLPTDERSDAVRERLADLVRQAKAIATRDDRCRLSAYIDSFKPNDEKKSAGTLSVEAQSLYPQLRDQLVRTNWLLLRTAMGSMFYDKSEIFAGVVQPKDQEYRWIWFKWSGLLTLALALLVPLDATSLHGFYRGCLAQTWIVPKSSSGSVDGERCYKLSDLKTHEQGYPYLLINATVNRSPITNRIKRRAPEDVFVFSPLYCGSEATGYLRTESFCDGYDLANAVAVSGAAPSPVYFQNWLVRALLLATNLRTGQWVPNPSYYKPSPGNPRRDDWAGLKRLRHRLIRRRCIRHSLIRLRIGLSWFRERIVRRPHQWLQPPLTRFRQRWTSAASVLFRHSCYSFKERPLCFVTDGGYVENLGLEQLLLRKCRVIIVSDCSCDPKFSFTQFLEVVRRVRSDRGIRIWRLPVASDSSGEATNGAATSLPPKRDELGLDRLIPRRTNPRNNRYHRVRRGLVSPSHLVLAQIRYPKCDDKGQPIKPHDESKDAVGLLIYLKPALDGDEPDDLLDYWAQNPDFPHQNTSDQFYDPDQFESYRLLGAHTAREVRDALKNLQLGDGDKCFERDVAKLLRWLGMRDQSTTARSGRHTRGVTEANGHTAEPVPLDPTLAERDAQ